MKRDCRFDVSRVLSMTYIVALVHLYAYIHPEVISANVIPCCWVLTNACLGLFTFVSGYLLGVKYCFTNKRGEVISFYKKRILRIFPLFVVASIALYLIGFNSARATINGLLCVSPFIEPSPKTLWYIPVILVCYLITPLVCRKSFIWRFISAMVVFLLVTILRQFIFSIDWRFQFNLLFYLLGLVTAPFFDWKLNGTPIIKWIVIATFMIMLVYTQFYLPTIQWRKFFAGVGVFAVLFISEIIADLVFKKEGRISRFVSAVSYASMTCYMFHRLFFWVGEIVWNPSLLWMKWVYMAGMVFPMMIVLSYFLQYEYDKIMKHRSVTC